MFLNALPVDLKKLVVSQGYKLPRLGELTTAARQQHELEVLREATVVAQRSYFEEKERIKTMITSLSPRPNNHHRFNSNFLSPNTAAPLLHYGPGSSAEQTIVSHQPGPNPKPLVTRDGIQYPVNPENGYISKWPATFRGCLGCGHSGHHFNSCPQSAIKSVRLVYWQELWCHIPSTRRQNRETRLNTHAANSSLNHLGSHQDTNGLGRGRSVNTPV